MHELSVCQGLIRQVEQIAASHDARAVSRITLRVGPLAGVETRLLREAFPIARAGSVAFDAELLVDPQPLRIRCLVCGHENEATPNRLLCNACGEWRTRLITGDELLLASVELIFDDAPAKEEPDHV